MPARGPAGHCAPARHGSLPAPAILRTSGAPDDRLQPAVRAALRVKGSQRVLPEYINQIPPEAHASPTVASALASRYSRAVRAAAPVLLVVGTALSYGVASIVGVPALVPVLNTLPAFPFMIGALRRGRVDQAVVRML